MTLTIVKFLDDAKCIGWSDISKLRQSQTHYRNTALLSDGSHVVMYNTHTTDINGYTSIGLWSEERPHIGRPNPIAPADAASPQDGGGNEEE